LRRHNIAISWKEVQVSRQKRTTSEHEGRLLKSVGFFNKKKQKKTKKGLGGDDDDLGCLFFFF